MALVQRTNPVGIDKKIALLQSKMYPALLKKWGEDLKYTCYPRCYRNQSDATGSYTAELFDGKDYKEVYFDDSVSVVSFFGISGESTFSQENQETTQVHLVFFMNLIETKGVSAERLDEEARLDVQDFLDDVGYNCGFNLQKAGMGIQYCLKEYPGSRQSMGTVFRDQHPLLAFRFDFTVYYQPTLIDCHAEVVEEGPV